MIDPQQVFSNLMQAASEGGGQVSAISDGGFIITDADGARTSVYVPRDAFVQWCHDLTDGASELMPHLRKPQTLEGVISSIMWMALIEALDASVERPARVVLKRTRKGRLDFVPEFISPRKESSNGALKNVEGLCSPGDILVWEDSPGD